MADGSGVRGSCTKYRDFQNELSIQPGPGRSFIGPSLPVLALTLALAEALAASELLAKKLILFSAWHTTSAATTVSLAFVTDLAPHVTPLKAFPYTSSIPSPAGLRQPPALSVIA